MGMTYQEDVLSPPFVAELHIISFDWDLGASFLPTVVLQNLRTLVIELCSPGPILDCLCSLEKMPPIHTLRLISAFDEDVTLTDKFLEQLGPCLKELEFSIVYERFL
jgi:hypothetical protein